LAASHCYADKVSVRSHQLSCGLTQGFENKFSIVIRVASINLTALLYAVVIVGFFGLEPRVYKLIIFASILIALPLGSAAIIKALQRFPQDLGKLIHTASMAVVMISAGSLACMSIVVWLFGISVPTSNVLIRTDLIVLVCCHFLGLLAAASLCGPPTRRRVALRIEELVTFGGRLTAPLSFLLVASAAMLITFHIGAGNPFLNANVALVEGLNPKPSWMADILSLVLAVCVLVICFRLLRGPKTPSARPLRPILNSDSAALAVAIVASAYFYFDYKLDTDVLHFMTNVGPASQIIFAHSVPMVTAFSQYGPGPMLLTWLTFLASSPSLVAANILSQLCSILFYSIMLICLFRMTPYRKAAMWLGFFSVGVLLAGWWSGNGSLNAVPSSMGLRYLPNGLLVLALSFLPRHRQLSVFVFLGMVLSALWSFETLAGSVAIFGLFILISSVRERSLRSFIRGLLLGTFAPIATSVVVLSCLTLFWAGALPNYLGYLQFALVYNMTSDFWSLDASGTFFGWIPAATIIMAVLTITWLSAFEGDKSGSPFDWEVLIGRFAPMAALSGFMASYFAGRSVDFTLIIAILPLSVLVIPAALASFHGAISGEKAAIQTAAVPVVVIFLAISFSFVALYRKDGPYSTAIAECLFRQNCTSLSLGKVVSAKFLLRPMLDQAANPNYFDTSGLAKDAIGLIARFSADRQQIPLFLGIHPATIWSVHTNTVLFLEKKGHRWPISYVLSDEINPTLKHSIIDADVHLQEGEPVFIRSDEGRLGPLEAAIVAKIRANVRLCPLSPVGPMVTAYRATYSAQCG